MTASEFFMNGHNTSQVTKTSLLKKKQPEAVFKYQETTAYKQDEMCTSTTPQFHMEHKCAHPCALPPQQSRGKSGQRLVKDERQENESISGEIG